MLMTNSYWWNNSSVFSKHFLRQTRLADQSHMGAPFLEGIKALHQLCLLADPGAPAPEWYTGLGLVNGWLCPTYDSNRIWTHPHMSISLEGTTVQVPLSLSLSGTQNLCFSSPWTSAGNLLKNLQPGCKVLGFDCPFIQFWEYNVISPMTETYHLGMVEIAPDLNGDDLGMVYDIFVF